MQKNHKKEKLPWRTAFQALNLTLFVNLNVTVKLC